MPPTPIAVTTGDPAGIGPDIALALAHVPLTSPIVLIGDRELLAERAAILKIKVRFTAPDQTNRHDGDGSICVAHISTVVPVQVGKEDSGNADYVLKQLETAVQGCLNGTFSAMTTAPVSKAMINRAGYSFTGHTEYLGKLTQCTTVMMLASEHFRVALATTHLPLREVADAITEKDLTKTLLIVNSGLQKYCGKDTPRIGVCGLNPHAGEQGYLGKEEQNIITPVIDALNHQGLNLIGPLPADTAFLSENLKEFDAFVAMFHDQGLPVIKHTGFGNVVNITLGLPFLRTSVDHGTAWSLAGSGEASPDSLITAIQWAASAVNTRA